MSSIETGRDGAKRRKRSRSKSPERNTCTNSRSRAPISYPIDHRIVPDGDLIFVVGKHKKRILVHSVIFTTASPVFAAMLKPHFIEGRRLLDRDGAPAEVLLPEDDAGAFLTICCVLHCPDRETKSMKAAHLVKVAILVDKYDFVSRFKFAAYYWFRNLSWRGEFELQNCWDAVMAAYWLQEDASFNRFSMILVKSEHSNSYLRHASQCQDQVLGIRLCLAIEECRIQRFKQLGSDAQTVDGLCLTCFKTAKESFTVRTTQCKHNCYHIPQVGS